MISQIPIIVFVLFYLYDSMNIIQFTVRTVKLFQSFSQAIVFQQIDET